LQLTAYHAGIGHGVRSKVQELETIFAGLIIKLSLKRKKTMVKKNLLLILLAAFVAGCTTCKGVRTALDGGTPPMILDSYASESVRPGATWRIFLETRDADGDIQSIIAQVIQPGVGYYPVDFTYIKGTDREGFAGYLILRTPTDSNLLHEYIQVKLTLLDCEGNKSEPVKFTLRFDYKSDYGPQEVPEKWKAAAERKIGTIMVEIRSVIRESSTNQSETTEQTQINARLNRKWVVGGIDDHKDIRVVWQDTQDRSL